ncbi:ComEA family DNA-binding protein [Acinetobacter guerrae]|uniref:ComEA family DNA-binding protein n=1 Tax=Acinetobacter guerrae TaxID=1843371 RepID=UPI00125EB42C|nr:ComEA family DNA-binding protein [Acinetobacter guerrae]
MITLRQISVYLIQIGILCVMSNLSYAQQFDQSYQSWKAQQQTHDQRLNASSSSDYYLSKPGLSKDVSKNSTAKNTNTSNIGTKVNINSATAQELQRLNGIGAKKAQAIVDYRDQNGRFKTVNDLLSIKGIGPKFIEKNKSNLSL